MELWRITFLSLLAAVVSIPLISAAGDKTQSSLTAPSALAPMSPPLITGTMGTSFTNGSSKGKSKGDSKCKLQIQIKGLTGIPDSLGIPGDGDEVICIADAVVAQGATASGSGTVVRGEVSGGSVKIKVNLVNEGIPCVGPVQQTESRVTCYEPDPTFTPAFSIPFSSDTTQGFCTEYCPRPNSPIIAMDGISIPAGN